VKLVIEEPQSRALERHLAECPTVLVTSRVAVVEVSRATKLANPDEQVQQEVDALLSSCTLVAVTAPLLRSARTLTSGPIRTLDAIHLASALRVEPDELIAYDRRLLRAAGDLGLTTVAPADGSE
jgi:predicted nucleic acid-binding protein